MRCIACDKKLTNKDLQIDEEFCSKCFKEYLDNLNDLNISED